MGLVSLNLGLIRLRNVRSLTPCVISEPGIELLEIFTLLQISVVCYLGGHVLRVDPTYIKRH
jgi:hypothetical protein